MGSMQFSPVGGNLPVVPQPVRGAFCFSPVVSPVIVRGWWVVTGLLTGTLLSPIPFRDACDWCPSHEEDDSSMSSITLSCYCS
jgi:fatty acid desaturase